MNCTRRNIFLSLFSISLSFIFACNGGEMKKEVISLPSIGDVPDSKWENLSKKRIYFGHQSVGDNIISGIEDVIKENPQIKLSTVEIKTLEGPKTAALAHSTIGKNTDPESKVDAFVNILEKSGPEGLDISFFKFCFVDIDAKTDLDKIFGEYKKAMSSLRRKFGTTIFIHITAPLLRKEKGGVKGWIKKALGKKGFFDNGHNVARNRFNELMRREYEGREPLFDLALIESTFPGGTRETFKQNGQSYYALVPEYTNDGGHLNEKGRKVVAEQLLIFLANLAR